jgi:hypothetical protein
MQSVGIAPRTHTGRGHVDAVGPRRFTIEKKGVENESPSNTAIGNRPDVDHSVSSVSFVQPEAES